MKPVKKLKMKPEKQKSRKNKAKFPCSKNRYKCKGRLMKKLKNNNKKKTLNPSKTK